MDRVLGGYCSRLEERFRSYSSTCPAADWQPGQPVTPELRNQAENYLAIAEIRSAFRYLICRSTRYEPYLPAFNLWYLNTIVVHNQRLINVTPSSSGDYGFLKTAELAF